VQNPVKFVDPDGKSIDVTEHEEGFYRVNNYIKDNDNGVYLINSDGKRGDKIAYTLTPESFYNSDEGWEINMKGAIIDPNDKSGKDFLNNFIEKNPNLISYMLNAGNGDKYDFKSTNGTDQQIYSQPVDYYRGMPVLGEIDGLPIWASARDIGNIAAGFVAARKGLIWNLARFGFDTYQSYKSKKFTSESSGTKFAQKIGHKIGSDYNYNENLNLRKKARLQGEGHLQSIDPIEIFNGIITRTGYQK
jgi:hypothetical protein